VGGVGLCWGGGGAGRWEGGVGGWEGGGGFVVVGGGLGGGRWGGVEPRFSALPLLLCEKDHTTKKESWEEVKKKRKFGKKVSAGVNSEEETNFQEQESRKRQPNQEGTEKKGGGELPILWSRRTWKAGGKKVKKHPYQSVESRKGTGGKSE